jgi:LacI family transcriptional regulator
MEAARERGIRIPEDLAVVGFDDIELAEHVHLTTMRQPMYDMGVLALDRLIARTTDPSAVPSVTSFLPRLIVRRTCGATGGRADGGIVEIPVVDGSVLNPAGGTA